MQLDRLQKTESLLKDSTILAPAEKNEWLGLLELMNDRQILELERILLSGEQRTSVPMKPISPQPMRQPAITAPPIKSISAQGNQPPFSHILNFPKGAAVVSDKPTVSSTQAPQVASQTVEPKKTSPFMAKLKAILGEKELPAPHQASLPAQKVSEISPTKQVAIASQSLPKEQSIPIPQKPVAPPKVTQPIREEVKSAQRPMHAVKQQPKPAEKPAPKAAPQSKPVPKAAEQSKPEPQPIEQPKPVQQQPLPQNVTINLVVDSSPKVVSGISSGSSLASILAQAQAQASAAAPSQPTTVIQAPPIVVAAPVSAPPPIQVVTVPAQPASPASPSLQRGEPSQGGPAAAEVVGAQSVPEQKQDISEIIKPFMSGQQSSVTPGLSIPEFSKEQMLKSKSAAPGADKSNLDTSQPAFKPVIQEKPGDDMKLETLADVVSLKPDDLIQHATGTLLRKLQKLIAQHGLHEVSFNLEKSPLYKAYVNTGVSLLKESAAGKTDLSRADFERFADLLIVTRAKS